MSSIHIIGKRLTPDEFDAYVRELVFDVSFAPEFVVIHNTGAPTLANRPSGFTAEHMKNLADYYGNDQKWNSGPHLFIDDNGIWLFSHLTRRGTHSPSWNGVSWGIEMLGDYDTEQFIMGRGAKVRQNALRATAALLRRLGKPATASTIRFHREDPKTTHKNCPGKSVVKNTFLDAVDEILQPEPVVIVPPGWSIVVDGKEIRQGVAAGEDGTGIARDVAKALGALVEPDSARKVITLRRTMP